MAVSPGGSGAAAAGGKGRSSAGAGASVPALTSTIPGLDPSPMDISLPPDGNACAAVGVSGVASRGARPPWGGDEDSGAGILGLDMMTRWRLVLGVSAGG